MQPAHPHILTINGGSSSIKFALYQTGEALQRRFYGQVDRIGLSGTHLTCNDPAGNQQDSHRLDAADHQSAANFLIDWLEEQGGFASLRAVGHRVVHGMQHTAPELVTEALLDELRRISPYDPEHLPREIELIEAFHSATARVWPPCATARASTPVWVLRRRPDYQGRHFKRPLQAQNPP